MANARVAIILIPKTHVQAAQASAQSALGHKCKTVLRAKLTSIIMMVAAIRPAHRKRNIMMKLIGLAAQFAQMVHM